MRERIPNLRKGKGEEPRGGEASPVFTEKGTGRKRVYDLDVGTLKERKGRTAVFFLDSSLAKGKGGAKKSLKD